VRVARRVDRAHQQDHEVDVARGERAAGLAEPAGPGRIARVVERRRQVGVGRADAGLRRGLLEAVGVRHAVAVEVDLERRAAALPAQEQPRQDVVIGRGRDPQPRSAGAVHQRVELDRRRVVVGAHAAGARRHAGEDRDVVGARPARVVRQRLAIDAAPAQVIEERQLVRAIEAQAVDHDQEHAVGEPWRAGILDRRCVMRERGLDLLEVVHERRTGEPGLHRADPAEHQQGERRRDDLASRCGHSPGCSVISLAPPPSCYR
jgi:hypothetical protein